VSGENGALPPEESEDFALVSRTLSVHNAVAIYVRRGIVPQRWVLAEWRNTLCDMRRGLVIYRRYRQETYGWQVFVELDALITSAEREVRKHGPGVGVGEEGHHYLPGTCAPTSPTLTANSYRRSNATALARRAPSRRLVPAQTSSPPGPRGRRFAIFGCSKPAACACLLLRSGLAVP
jgi:hypothetical protein